MPNSSYNIMDPASQFWRIFVATLLYIPAEPRWFLALFCFIVGQNIGCVKPLGVIVEQGALFVQAVGPQLVRVPSVHHLPLLPAVIYWWSEIIGAMGKSAVGSVLHTVAPEKVLLLILFYFYSSRLRLIRIFVGYKPPQQSLMVWMVL